MHRQHFLQRMSPEIVAVVVLFTAAAASGEHTAAINKPMVLTQAGSTGGTIGKQDKSASGGEVRVPTRARQAPLVRKRKHHVAARDQRAPRVPKHHVSEAGDSRCRKIVGTWTVSAPGVGEATFDQNGGGRYTFFLGVTGKWTCANGIVIVTWNNGVVSRVLVSHDGNSYTGTNNDGTTYAGMRK
jgi:hypothetical protein